MNKGRARAWARGINAMCCSDAVEISYGGGNWVTAKQLLRESMLEFRLC